MSMKHFYWAAKVVPPMIEIKKPASKNPTQALPSFGLRAIGTYFCKKRTSTKFFILLITSMAIQKEMIFLRTTTLLLLVRSIYLYYYPINSFQVQQYPEGSCLSAQSSSSGGAVGTSPCLGLGGLHGGCR